MIKAVAGGGGMGIRIVETEQAFLPALQSTRREAGASFGDDRVLLERYFDRARHIEVQVVGDGNGNSLHCFDRECSIQRRRQKVIEEAPSPRLDADLRRQMYEASLKIADATRYAGLGTVEFIVVEEAGTSKFYFLEMNTRLQVEHGVTEEVTGVDLVRLQIDIAAGQPLRLSQSDIVLAGHAIECRLCAEDPVRDFQPMTGTIDMWHAAENETLRIDTAIRQGAQVSSYYDSLLAKAIAVGADRLEAIRRMRRGLRDIAILGIETNQHFLSRILDETTYLESNVDTLFIDRHIDSLNRPVDIDLRDEIGVVCAILLAGKQTEGLGSKCFGAFERHYAFEIAGQALPIFLRYCEDESFTIKVDDRDYLARQESTDSGMRIAINGRERNYRGVVKDSKIFVAIGGIGSFIAEMPETENKRRKDETESSYTSVMTGVVTSVSAQSGKMFDAGDELFTIESMKMEHRIHAEETIVVDQVFVTAGQVIEAGAALLSLKEMVSETRPEGMEGALR